MKSIPEELKKLNQWALTTKNKIPYNPITHEAVSAVNANQWLPFRAVNKFKTSSNYYAFLLTKNDPYCIIDIDDKQGKGLNWLQNRILERTEGYKEVSMSGYGYHIIVIARSQNLKDTVSGIEIYSDSRYFALTGNVYKNNKIITNRQIELDQLNYMLRYRQVSTSIANGQTKDRVVFDDENNITMYDQEVYRKLEMLPQKQLIIALFNGNWQGVFPSASEADLSLLSFIYFVCRNKTQTKRIFRTSLLSQRDKHKTDYRINLAISRIIQTENRLMQFRHDFIQRTAESFSSSHTLPTARKFARSRFDNSFI